MLYMFLKGIAALLYPFFAVFGRLWWVSAALSVGNSAAVRYLVRTWAWLLISAIVSAPQFANTQVTQRDLERLEDNQERLGRFVERNQESLITMGQRIYRNEVNHNSLEERHKNDREATNEIIREFREEARIVRWMLIACTLVLAGVIKATELMKALKRMGSSPNVLAVLSIFSWMRQKVGL